jgi:hypothetical protein
MMIISDTKDIFMKRAKRMKKMVACDCSSEESSASVSRSGDEVRTFSSSIFVRTIYTE